MCVSFWEVRQPTSSLSDWITSLPSGVPAGGWASAAAGFTAQWSSQTHRHAAATLQSSAGEEAVCENEGRGTLHPGRVSSVSAALLFTDLLFYHKNWNNSWSSYWDIPRCLTKFAKVYFLMSEASQSFESWRKFQRVWAVWQNVCPPRFSFFIFMM